DQATLFQPVHQLHDAVVFEGQAICEDPDGSFGRLWQAADRQKDQVLLRLEPRLECFGITLSYKKSASVTQFCQCAILLNGNRRTHQVLSYHDIYWNCE